MLARARAPVSKPRMNCMRLCYGRSGALVARIRSIPAARRAIWDEWRLLLPGASEPRLTLLRRQDFRSVFQTALRGLSNRSIVVVGNYESGPITAEPCRAKARPLHPRRSCFAPVSGISIQRSAIRRTCVAPITECWLLTPGLVEAPGTAPGSDRFITTAIYRHSRQAGLVI